MEELKRLFSYVGVTAGVVVLLMVLSYVLARRKGRDTIGWFLAPFFFGINVLVVVTAVAFCLPDTIGWGFIGLSGAFVTVMTPVILALLPPVETVGLTRRCPDCAAIVSWKAASCKKCGRELELLQAEHGVKVKHPLRTCFLYESLLVLLMAIVFGFIGYFCVPDQPRIR